MTACCFSVSFESSRCVMAAKDGVLIRRRLRIFAAAVALVLLCAVCVGAVSGADVWDGNVDTTWYTSKPTSTTTYTIYTAEELAGLAELVNGGNNFEGKTIVLGDNLLLNEDDVFEQAWGEELAPTTITNLHEWEAIGTEIHPFVGTFDGNGYYIGNLYSSFKQNDAVRGLFGCVAVNDGKKGTIQNVKLMEVLYLPVKNGNLGATLGGLVGHLKGGIVKDCHVIISSKFGVGNNGGGNSIGGLVGEITDDKGNKISSSNIATYLQGGYSVAEIICESSRQGLIVGTPSIGVGNDAGSGNNKIYYGKYNVSVYEMDIAGNYPSSPKYGPTTTVTEIGPVNIDYLASPGFSIDTGRGQTSGTVSTDKTLELSIYLKRNEYTITFMNDSKLFNSITARYEVPLQALTIPIKPGHEFVGWNPAIPSTMPANDMTVHAVWEYINPIFTITIPEDIPLDNTTLDGSKYVGVDITQLSDIGNLSITVSSANSYHLILKNHPDISLNYNLFIDGSSSPAVQDGVVGLFKGPVSTQNLKSIPIRAVVNETPRYSGSYSDTLTFTVKYTETN